MRDQVFIRAAQQPDSLANCGWIKCVEYRERPGCIQGTEIPETIIGAARCDHLLALSRERGVLEIDLGPLDLSSDETIGMLVRFKQLRESSRYGLRLIASIGTDVSFELACLLRAAGLKQITISSSSNHPRARAASLASMNKGQLSSLKNLHTVEIDVCWTLFLPEPGGFNVTCPETSFRLSPFFHLPPPVKIRVVNSFASLPDIHAAEKQTDTGDADERIAYDPVSTWLKAHKPRSLSYAQGPGFVKICDKRHGEGNWRFITLQGLRAEVYLFCRVWRSLSEIASFAAGVPQVRIESLLKRLIEADLMGSTSGGDFLATATRKLVEERWVSH